MKCLGLFIMPVANTKLILGVVPAHLQEVVACQEVSYEAKHNAARKVGLTAGTTDVETTWRQAQRHGTVNRHGKTKLPAGLLLLFQQVARQLSCRAVPVDASVAVKLQSN